MQFKAAAMRLSVVLEADASALVRVLQFFQARNVVPRSVTARRKVEALPIVLSAIYAV